MELDTEYHILQCFFSRHDAEFDTDSRTHTHHSQMEMSQDFLNDSFGLGHIQGHLASCTNTWILWMILILYKVYKLIILIQIYFIH